MVYKGVYFVLTCAHNVVDYSELDEEFFEYSDLTAYSMRKGEEIYASKRTITKVAYHPYFNNTTSCGFEKPFVE